MALGHVLIAPDKFKGTLTGRQAGDAIARGLARCDPAVRCTVLPIADGGEGTTEAVLAGRPGAVCLKVSTTDAFHRPRTAEIALLGDTAVCECAAAAGLSLLAKHERDPWRASTRGVGMLIRAAIAAGARRVLLGLGGSATNDAGLGMAHALGWRFLDAAGREIDPVPVRFGEIEHVAPPPETLDAEIVGLCDVTNPLLGAEGASVVYGPQKGLRDPLALDAALHHVAEVIGRDLGVDCRTEPGAGAAGGLGFGLLVFCRGRLAPGFETIAELTNLEVAVRACERVVTGEGRIDRQTLYGKGPAELARLARRHGKPITAFCGTMTADVADTEVFDAIVPIVDEQTSLEQALSDPAGALASAVSRHFLKKITRT